MKKFNHEHKSNNVIQCCGFDNEEVEFLTQKFNEIVYNANSPSEAVETIEKYIQEEDKNDTLIRFLIVNYLLYLANTGKEHLQELLKDGTFMTVKPTSEEEAKFIEAVIRGEIPLPETGDNEH